MGETDLIKLINKMYQEIDGKDKGKRVALLGILFGDIIKKENITLENILKNSIIEIDYYDTFKKGIELSDFVIAKEEITKKLIEPKILKKLDNVRYDVYSGDSYARIYSIH